MVLAVVMRIYVTVDGNGGGNRIVSPPGDNRQASYRRVHYPPFVALSDAQALPMGN
jgi:hypothetical protein